MRKAQKRRQQRGKVQRGNQDRGIADLLGELKTWPLLDPGSGHFGITNLEAWGLCGATIPVT